MLFAKFLILSKTSGKYFPQSLAQPAIIKLGSFSFSNESLHKQNIEKITLKFEDKLIAHDVMLPAQLRKVLPGIKNAFCSTIKLFKKDQENNITEIFKTITFRTATIVPVKEKDQDERDAAAAENIKVLQQYIDQKYPDKKNQLHFVVLNTDMPQEHQDRIIAGTKGGIKKVNEEGTENVQIAKTLFSNVAVNFIGAIFFRAIIAQVDQSRSRKNYEKYVKPIGKALGFLMVAIVAVLSYPLLRPFNKQIDIKYNSVNRFKQAAKVVSSHWKQQEAVKNEKDKIKGAVENGTYIVLTCASGQDRTGTAFITAFKQLLDKAAVKDKKITKVNTDALYANVIKSNDYQLLTSLVSPGSIGHKLDTEVDVMSRDLQKLFFLKSASTNKKLHTGNTENCAINPFDDNLTELNTIKLNQEQNKSIIEFK